MTSAKGQPKLFLHTLDSQAPDNRESRASSPASSDIPLIAHVIYRLDIGGLENGLVSLINGIPAERYRHVIICLTDFSGFRSRIRREDIPVFALKKREGKDFRTYFKLWRLLKKLRPTILHTRNLPTVDGLFIGALAGVPHRVHGEHGRDMLEVDGKNWKYNFLRRISRSFVDTYIPLSKDLAMWLRDEIGAPERKIVQIYNGVDTHRFHPVRTSRAPLPIADFAPPGTIVIGSVGRLAAVKDPTTLVRAFVQLLERVPHGRERLRLVLVGDGPLYSTVERVLRDAEVQDIAWLAGSREDIPKLLRGFDVFALPSLAEGISNTVLEAMATGLPVVATRVGGTPELVIDGTTGLLVSPAEPLALALALKVYVGQPELRRSHGQAGRERAEREFGLAAMVSAYQGVYDAMLNQGHERRS